MSQPVAVRPLPARPDLESERKHAKKLLREVHRGDADAVTRIRAQNRGLATTAPEEMKLADAQLAIAREYGFRSWPLLVRYFEAFDRHQRSHVRRARHSKGFYEGWPETLLAEHRDKRGWTALQIGAFVPRFYGASVEEIFASEITLEEARLVVAREYGFANWSDVLTAAASDEGDAWTGQETPLRKMSNAVRAGDLPALQSLVASHPDLLKRGNGPMTHLGYSVVHKHIESPSPTTRAMMEWVESVGISIQETLNHRFMSPLSRRLAATEAQRLIDEGGDPNWIAPNGYSILEHAIYRWWSGPAVDVILKHTKPRDRFWVAAGIGDVGMLRRHFDRSGKLTAAAREDRPDMLAIVGHGTAPMPGADDPLILWDAALAAALNGRAETLDFLLEHGFPIDYHFGMTLLNFAIGNALVPMVELLLSRGASLDVRGWRPNMTGREMATEYHGNRPDDAEGRRIIELCGFNPDDVYREADATRPAPEPAKHLVEIHSFARQDAIARDQKEVQPENFFVAVLREGSSMMLQPLAQGGADVARLRATYEDRIAAPLKAPVEPLPNSQALNDIYHAAAADSVSSRSSTVMAFQAMASLLATEAGAVQDAIRAAGGDVTKVRAVYERYGRPVNPQPRP